MIKIDNLREVLKSMEFKPSEDNNYYSRKYAGKEIAVDFKNKSLLYPENTSDKDSPNGIIINERTTCNFAQNENFVVFECVCRLLEKGYRSEHIELEPRWQLGHGLNGGRADILVRDENRESYIIIECKRAGSEYDKEKKNTEANGGQLFSYWQQVTSTKWLALYASDWDGLEVTRKCDVIHTEDDANILVLATKDKSILTYKDAKDEVGRYTVWKETYQKQWLNNTIFDEESDAYKVGIPPLRKGKLVDFGNAQSIINSFEEILRHNNVSDKENAFNRLVALFICKLEDEINKSDEDIVEFQYKQGTDTYESLQDRLQQLHVQGMRNFMQENLFYVKSDFAEELFQQHMGPSRKEAIKELNEVIRKLKFYTNNDFAFKDVHNEDLFYQNGKILVEVVQLFQPYRIVFASKNQILGELFEGLLSKGFKQNQGQFFTPMPITRFIWDSIPLRKYIKTYGIPNVIDYACGAGHFLIDAIEAIESAGKMDSIEEIAQRGWIKRNIYGIEKDYRLARVSKVSMFMNGAGETNIIFGDGLENYPDKGVKNKSFDILVANPPYSIDCFKQHLNIKNSFELLDELSEDSDDIEVLFIERIAQLLKPQGIAAVILPASVRNNSNPSCFVNAREVLIKNFYIRAIVELGGKTFGATSTNTIILFLERHKESPCIANLNKDSVNSIMEWEVNEELTDNEILEEYITHQGIEREDYMRFVRKNLTYEEIKIHPYFKIYAEMYDNMNVRIPRKASFEEAKILKLSKFYENVLKVEWNKIYYFSLIYKQQTLVIKAPSSNDEQKDFLGYYWSKREGQEGMHIRQPGGKLYDELDRYKEGTLASAIRNSFANKFDDLTDAQQKYTTSYWLKDLVNFTGANFNIEIATVKLADLEFQSKYEKVDLKSVVKIIKGVTYTKEQQTTEETKSIILTADNITLDGHLEITKKIYLNTDTSLSEEKMLKKGDCFMCFSSGSKKHVGKVCYISEDLEYYAGGFMGILRATSEVCDSYYLSCLLNHEKYRKLIVSGTIGSNINNLSSNIGLIKIPLPPIDVQLKIVTECASIDEFYNQSKNCVEEYQQKINGIFTKLISHDGKPSVYELVNLSQMAKSIEKGKAITQEQTVAGEYKVVAGGKEYAYKHNDYNREADVITVSASGAYAGYVNLWHEKIFASDCTTIYGHSKKETSYIYYYLKSIQDNLIATLQRGSDQPHVYPKDIQRIQIPLLPKDKLESVVKECEAYDEKIEQARTAMNSCVSRKMAIIDKYLL